MVLTIITDKIILGCIAGFAGNIAKETITWPLHWMGYVRYTFVHIGAGYFVPAKFIDNPVSLASGFLADWTVAGFFGVVLMYLISSTGKDYAIFKGILLGSLFYLFFYGALMALDVTRASLLTPLPNLLLFFPHLVLGAVSGWFIERYARNILS